MGVVRTTGMGRCLPLRQSSGPRFSTSRRKRAPRRRRCLRAALEYGEPQAVAHRTRRSRCPGPLFPESIVWKDRFRSAGFIKLTRPYGWALVGRAVERWGKLQLHDIVGPFEAKSDLDHLRDACGATQTLRYDADRFWVLYKVDSGFILLKLTTQ